MRKTMARAAATVLATAAMTTGVVTATAGSASAAPCGYYWTGSLTSPLGDYYNHCGSRHTEVYVYMRFGGSGWYCLPPGITNLVSRTGRNPQDIYYARSYGDPCW